VSASRHPAHRTVPPVYFLAALVVMAALHFTLPIATLIHPPYTYLGILLVGGGLWMVIWAARLFSRAGTPIKPFERSTHLVTGGPYRITRNPMYLGMVAGLIGVGLLLGSLSPWLVIPAFVYAIQRFFVRHEEALMEERFGEDYLRFKSRVRRWI
jgi:protein-S-isoprenylcysteine O-methyltransferase Ste14